MYTYNFVVYSDPILNDAAQKYESKPVELKEQEKEKIDEEDTLLDHLLKITTGMYLLPYVDVLSTYWIICVRSCSA